MRRHQLPPPSGTCGGSRESLSSHESALRRRRVATPPPLKAGRPDCRRRTIVCAEQARICPTPSAPRARQLVAGERSTAILASEPWRSIAAANASSSDVVASRPMSSAISRFSSSVTTVGACASSPRRSGQMQPPHLDSRLWMSCRPARNLSRGTPPSGPSNTKPGKSPIAVETRGRLVDYRAAVLEGRDRPTCSPSPCGRSGVGVGPRRRRRRCRPGPSPRPELS